MRPLLLFLLLLPGVASSDEVILTGGGRLSCQIIEESEADVTVRLPHGTMVIPRARIAGVVRENTSDYLKREGARSLRAGSARSAVELFERALASDPRDRDTRRRLLEALGTHADLLVKTFRLREARRALERMARLQPGAAGAAELIARVEEEEQQAARLFAGARRALDQGAYLDAIVLLDAWRLRRPPDDESVPRVMAEAHLGAARTAEKFGALRQALDHYRMARGYGARREASEPLYLLRPIAVLEALKQGDTGEAARLLDGIATTYPHLAVPVFLKAVLHHVQGHVDEAVAAYAEAARIAERGRTVERGLDFELVRAHATSTLRAAIARPPQEGVATWRELFLGPLEESRGVHLTVYAASAKTASGIAAVAERTYERIAKDLLGSLPKAAPAEVVIHPSRSAYLAADPTPPGTPLAALTIGREKTLGVCYDTLDEKGARLVRIEIDSEAKGYLEDTLPHEIVHVVQRQGLEAFRKGHWLDEGLATIYESAEGQAKRATMWRRLKKSRLALPELLNLRSTPPDKVALFYVQSHMFCRFLRDLRDDRAWRRFLAVYGEATFERAIGEAYDIESIGVLERLWEASLEE